MVKVNESLIEKKRNEEKETKSFFAWLLIIVLFFSALICVNNYVLGCVVVDGSSMENTFFTGDILFTNRLKTPEYGDVIIIDGESARGLLIKRVIGKGGDTVRIEDGFVFLKKAGESEFTKLEEPYIKSKGATYYPAGSTNSDRYEITVGDGEIFYLGDNRMVSNDSRSQFHTCEESQVCGVVSEWAIENKDDIKWLCTISIKIRSIFNIEGVGVKD